MRTMGFALGLLVAASSASAAVIGTINFSDRANGTYQGSASNNSVDDLTTTGTSGDSFAFRALPAAGATGGAAFPGTVINAGRITNQLSSEKLYLRNTSNYLFDLVSMQTQRYLTGATWNTDVNVIGVKADNSTVSQTVTVNTDALSTFTFNASLFTGLKEVRFDLAGGSGTRIAYYDNIVYSIPEPAALSVLGLAVGTALIRRRRQA